MERMKQELAAGGSDMADASNQASLKIREGPGGVYVEGQSKVEIRSMAEMGGIIFAAIENRMVSPWTECSPRARTGAAAVGQAHLVCHLVAHGEERNASATPTHPAHNPHLFLFFSCFLFSPWFSLFVLYRRLRCGRPT